MNKKAHLFGITLISASLLLFCSCEKEGTGEFSIQINLVDQLGVQKSQFEKGDSLIFEFYLSNLTGSSAEYLRPCTEFIDFFNIYRENASGSYEFYGRPEYSCVLIAIYMTIEDQETILLNRIPWSTLLGWPNLQAGKYYVGDVLTIRIDGKAHDFNGRIYFEILE